MFDNKVNLWRSSIMLFSFWSSSTQSLCSFNNQIVPVQISQLLLSGIFTKLVNIQQPSVTWREICSWTWLCDIFPLLKRKNLVKKFNLSEIHPPGTQSLQWPVSPPWSWSSWRGHSPPIHRHTCRLKKKYLLIFIDIEFVSQNSKCERKTGVKRKDREGNLCIQYVLDASVSQCPRAYHDANH